MVHHAAQAKRALALAVVALAGCGDDPRPAAAPASTEPLVVQKDLGQDMRLANCTDWARGDDEGRRGTIAEIRSFAGGAVDNGYGSTLPEDEAYALFENWCARPYARRFKLYKLYVRAAAFEPGDE